MKNLKMTSQKISEDKIEKKLWEEFIKKILGDLLMASQYFYNSIFGEMSNSSK